METMAAERAGVRRAIGTQSAVAYVGAAALVIAAVWYGLASEGVTVDSEPTGLNGLPFDDRFDAYFGWYVTTFAQERLYTGFAILGFLCVIATALFVRPRLAAGRPLASVGVQALVAGAGLWVVGNVLSLGGHHVVETMFARHDPRDDIYSMNLLIDLVDDGFELAAFLLLGLGMLALGVAAVGAWARFTVAVGLVLLATAGAYAAQSSA